MIACLTVRNCQELGEQLLRALPRRARARPLPRLAPLGVIAGAHHERLDGSGYHRGSAGAQLYAGAGLLAEADCYQAMTHARTRSGPPPSCSPVAGRAAGRRHGPGRANGRRPRRQGGQPGVPGGAGTKVSGAADGN